MGPPILVRILVKFFSPSAQDSWWNRKTLGEMEKLLVKLKSSWWNAWNLGEMESHLVKFDFAKIKTIQEIWFVSLRNHGSYLVNLAYKLINSKNIPYIMVNIMLNNNSWFDLYIVHVVWSIHWKLFIWSMHWKCHT